MTVKRMLYELALDTKKFSDGLGDAEKGAKGTFDGIEDKGEKSAGKFDGLGGKMGKALVAGFSAVGVGALLMQGINSAMDAEAGVRKLTGQFALTEQEAKRYGDAAGKVYAAGWGNGLAEVQQAVGLTAQKLGTTTDEELQKITGQVLAVAGTWDVDFNDVIRSTSQLLENDLAPDAEEALDLVVAAFQGGGDEAGDLLETIDEYSQHWADMGLSGEDALNQIVHGLQNGQRDADKLADAVKEMRIRVVDDSKTTAEAYRDLGLDAEATRQKFLEGGPAAREAFLEVIGALRSVKDPYEQNRLAVALIGTQFEDLGTRALDSLANVDGALDDTTGKAAALAVTVGATDWKKLQREGETALTGLGSALLAAFEIADAATGGGGGDAVTQAWEDAGYAVAENGAIIGKAAEVFETDWTTAAGRVHTSLRPVVEDLGDVEEATGDAKAENQLAFVELKKLNEQYDDLGPAISLVVEETDELVQSTRDLYDEIITVNGSMFDYEKSVLNLDTAVGNLAGKTGTELREAQIGAAEDALATSLAFAESKYQGDNAALSATYQRDELQRLQEKYPELRAEIGLYIAELDRIPANINTKLTLTVDTVSGATTTLSGDAIRSAQGQYGSLVVGAHGGVVTRPTMALIGEAGPEAVVPLDKTPGSSPLPGGGMMDTDALAAAVAQGMRDGWRSIRLTERAT